MSIVEIFRLAYQKYGCKKALVVDNLMSARFHK